MLIENCSAHFPSTRNNQIDAATNQSKQVHCQTKVFPRLARGRLCGVEVIRTMISNRIYNIFTRVSQCFAIFETISCALFLCGSLRAFFALISTFYKVYCTKQIYADNLHNKCRGLSDWVGCKIARISILKEPNKAQIPMLR